MIINYFDWFPILCHSDNLSRELSVKESKEIFSLSYSNEHE